MDNYERRNRIEEALRIRNMRQIELCEKAKVDKSSLNHWINHHWQPKQKSLSKMAKALDVSEMWLAGYDVPMERPVTQIKNDELTQLIFEIKENEDLKDLFSSICSLNDDQRKTISSMVSELSKLNSLH